MIIALICWKKYKMRLRCFNDDIQGTGAVIASGFINAVKLSGTAFDDHKILFYGAGSAAIGVADQIVKVLEAQGVKNATSKFLSL